MTDRPPIPSRGAAITGDWMSRALAAGDALGAAPIKQVMVEPIGSGLGLLSDILRCHLTYDEELDARRADSEDGPAQKEAPATVIVKLPSSQAKSRHLSKRFHLYKREYDYYNRVGPHVPLRTPTLLYGDYASRNDRFVLVLEDLCAMATADQIVGATEDQAKRAVRGIAKLHGHYWNKVDRAELSGCRNELARKYRPLVQIVYLANLAPTLHRFAGVFSPAMRRTAEAYGPHVAEHMGILASGPLTFTHGDLRLDNLFFGDGNDNADLAVIDWQVSAIHSGLYDIAYFLATSVASDVRRRVEREALEQYHAIVRDMGASEFTFEECWHLYRQNILGRLVTAVITCGGLDLTDERSQELAEISLRRTLTAIEDLDADALIPAGRPIRKRGRRPDISGTPFPGNVFSGLSRGAYILYRRLYRP